MSETQGITEDQWTIYAGMVLMGIPFGHRLGRPLRRSAGVPTPPYVECLRCRQQATLIPEAEGAFGWPCGEVAGLAVTK